MKRSKRGVTAIHEPDRPIRVIVDPRNPDNDRMVPAELVRSLYRQNILSFDVEDEYYCVPENGVVPPEIAHCLRASEHEAKTMLKSSRNVKGVTVYVKKSRRLE